MPSTRPITRLPPSFASLCLLFAAALAVQPNAHAVAAKGLVFEDLNGNGQHDSNEPGLAGVRVSDGITVTSTDSSGQWQLRIDDQQAIVFVVKPSGFATPVTRQQLPRFHHIHQPAGSPAGMRYPGIAPTGALPESINFPLVRQHEPSRFEAILFADPQPQTEKELDYIRDTVVTELIGTDAKFGMTMGDITYDDLSLLPRLLDIISQVGIPWYNVPGNHELNLDAVDDAHSLETFKAHFGPPWYSFEYANALFVVLDNIEYQGNGKADPGDVRGNGGYIAKFGKQQLRWLERELAEVPNEKLVFLAMHAPLGTYLDPERAGVNTEDRRDLFRLLSGRPNLYAVAGHTHTSEHRYFGAEDGFKGPGKLHHHVLSTVSGSWWSGPFDVNGIPTSWERDGGANGYQVLEVDGSKATVRFKGAGLAANNQMRISYDVHHHTLRKEALRDFRHGEMLDGRMTIDQVPAADVLVNLFDGGPNSKVTFTVAGRGPFTMARVERIDPWLLELFTRNEDTRKYWVQAMPSSHLWQADLPDDLPVGVHTLSVQATDEFGRSHHGHSVLEIQGR